MIEVRKIETPQEQAIAHKIREEVFVKEQNVPFEEEYDEYEQTSVHFLAFYEGKPCGTARWRFTENGIKLERFAVLKEFRNKKVGKAILEAVLENIKNTTETAKKTLYLHSQVQVVGFYEKFGFQKIGETFQECDIWHYKMIKVF
jgi:predicted GNAT family N-acyltransferase